MGPDIHLMIDAFHWYSRTEALELGRGLEKLGFAWIEEPLDEQSMSTYAWLTKNLDIPVLGPESAAGKHFTRAEWIKAEACDILRTGVHDVGGITPALKSMRLAESFGMNCEVHGNGVENLIVTAVSKNCRWYERGLLHPSSNTTTASTTSTSSAIRWTRTASSICPTGRGSGSTSTSTSSPGDRRLTATCLHHVA